jgi:hypothetical protein
MIVIGYFMRVLGTSIRAELTDRECDRITCRGRAQVGGVGLACGAEKGLGHRGKRSKLKGER